jgi:hypothetical protein
LIETHTFIFLPMMQKLSHDVYDVLASAPVLLPEKGNVTNN